MLGSTGREKKCKIFLGRGGHLVDLDIGSQRNGFGNCRLG